MNNKSVHEIQNQTMPLQLTGNKIGSWANYSIVKRLPEIGHRIIDENEYSAEIIEKLLALYREIPDGKLPSLQPGSGGEDVSAWNAIIHSYREYNWLEAPWFFIEFYFYRRILEIIGYFNARLFEENDPFQYQKNLGFTSSIKPIASLLDVVRQLERENKSSMYILDLLINTALRGNQVDLSIWPLAGHGHKNDQVSSKDRAQFIVNQNDKFITWFQDTKPRRVDIFIDNAGYELLCDLMLVDFLLSRKLVEQIVLHVKPYPIFVSDVMKKDLAAVIDNMAETTSRVLKNFSSRLKFAKAEGRIIVRDNLFWGLPIPMREMPKNLYNEIASSDLIISKGDANYRRLLGDRLWPYDKPLDEVLSYLPTSLLALRMLKSEIGAGYSAERINEIEIIDDLWMQNGQWGSIQFVNK